MKRRQKLLALLTFLIIFSACPAADAALHAVDPGPYTAATGMFPLWYQDTRGVPLELCLSKTLSPGGLPMCPLLAEPGFDPALPISFPGNFPPEAFWFTADARVRGANFDLRLTIALEAAITPEGFPTSFARIRVRGSVPSTGTYIFTHPYGEEVLNITELGNRAVNYTRDVGIGASGIFTGALAGDIGPFLIRTDARGNPSPVVIGTETFLGDPNANQTVTGSPLGTNFFRVQGPGVNSTTNLFSISGKVYKGGEIPTPLVVDRASYSSGALGTQMDIFAIAPAPAIMSFNDASPSAIQFPMDGDAEGRFYAQALVPPALLGPVDITAVSTPYGLPSMPGNSVKTILDQKVTDVVSITRAEYLMASGSLIIEAVSSDGTGPELSAPGFGVLAPDALAVPPPAVRLELNVPIPPAAVTVTSLAGGSDTEQVTIVPAIP